MNALARLGLRGTLRRTDRGAFLIFLGIMAFFTLFLFVPLLYVFVGAFFIKGELTAYYFSLVFTDPLYRESLVNSLLIGLFATIATSFIAVPVAYLLVRFDFPLKRAIQGLLLAPLVMPPFVGAIGMKQFFGRYGSVNLVLMQLGLISSPVDWFGGGFWGVVLREALHLYPFLYLNTAAALANIDPTLEEQAENLGSSGFRLFRTVTFPLVLPGYLAGAIIVFVWAFTDLGTPLIFDFRYALPPLIFTRVQDIWVNPMGYGLTVLTLMVSILAVLVTRRYVSRKSYEMLGRGHVQPRVRKLRGLKLILAYLALILVVLAAFTPQISVVVTSLAEVWFFSPLPQVWTERFYILALTHPVTTLAIRNSLLYSIGSTAIDLLLGVLIGYLLARKTFPGKDLLDSVAMMPLALPGIVIAFGYLATFTGTPLDPFVNPVPLLIISYSVRRLPYSVRAAYAGFQQTSVALEEASLSVGASPLRTLLSITAPLILANVVAGGIMTFSASMMEVSDSLILAAQEPFYPITKSIYALNNRIQDGPFIASALGIIGTLIVVTCLLLANKLLGRSMGELFRA
ncbi:MAG: iron ABC transporter permease [Candidatus Bathyarchaeia archaeon]